MLVREHLAVRNLKFQCHQQLRLIKNTSNKNYTNLIFGSEIYNISKNKLNLNNLISHFKL